WMNANVLRIWNKPTSWYRSAAAIVGAQQQYNYGGDLTGRQYHVYAETQLANLWNISAFTIQRPATLDDRLLRGGPAVGRPALRYYEANVGSDGRKRVSFNSNANIGRTSDGRGSYSGSVGISIKPSSRVLASLSPTFSHEEGSAEYVRGFTDPSATAFFGNRTVVADLEQNTLSMETRLSVTFTPALTLQLFAQPFVASGDYTRFKEFVQPHSGATREFDGTQLTTLRGGGGRDSAYVLDPDRDASTANFRFGNPDFNFRSLRGNAVVRWEYRPGSTLFFVWQQERSGGEEYGDFRLSRDAGSVFRDRPDNVFVIKASWWLSR
ncbi:MAG TPA: DUF5916 domain-containing protein, partial [Longimicrobiaceae bacterium]|nr:DUF5916 domain-containing protein [Longimicrobiaceae bacterium]